MIMVQKKIKSAKKARKILKEGSHSFLDLYCAQKFFEERKQKRKRRKVRR